MDKQHFISGYCTGDAPLIAYEPRRRRPGVLNRAGLILAAFLAGFGGFLLIAGWRP